MGEARFVYRTHNRWAQVTVRVEPEAEPRLALWHLLEPTHEVFEFWPGILSGVEQTSAALGLLAARVTLVDAKVHPTDSNTFAFSHAVGRAMEAALAKTTLEPVALPATLFPWVRTAGADAVAELGGVRVELERVAQDRPVDWTARWSDIDPRAHAWAGAELAQLRAEVPPWVGVVLHFGDSLRKGAGASQEAIALTVALAMAQAGPATRRAVGLPAEDLRLKT
jgi:hypothetical protein